MAKRRKLSPSSRRGDTVAHRGNIETEGSDGFVNEDEDSPWADMCRTVNYWRHTVCKFPDMSWTFNRFTGTIIGIRLSRDYQHEERQIMLCYAGGGKMYVVAQILLHER